MSRKHPRQAATPAPASPAAPLPAAQPATTCHACGSTARDAYTQESVQEYAGVDPSGIPYTHIRRCWTRCTVCGQARIDRILECRRP